MSESESDYYALLGLRHDATAEQVQDQWRGAVRRNHPDHATGPEDSARRTEATAQANAAYAVLKDPDRRALYDLWRAALEQEALEAAQAQAAAEAPDPVDDVDDRRRPGAQADETQPPAYRPAAYQPAAVRTVGIVTRLKWWGALLLVWGFGYPLAHWVEWAPLFLLIVAALGQVALNEGSWDGTPAGSIRRLFVGGLRVLLQIVRALARLALATGLRALRQLPRVLARLRQRAASRTAA